MIDLQQPLQTYANHIGVAERIMVSGVMLLYASIAGYHLYHINKLSPTLKIMLTGIGLMTSGWAIHRMYFAAFWYHRIIGDYISADWYFQNMIYTIIPTIFVISGSVLTIVPTFIKKDQPFSWKPYIIGLILAFGAWWLITWRLIIAEKAGLFHTI